MPIFLGCFEKRVQYNRVLFIKVGVLYCRQTDSTFSWQLLFCGLWRSGLLGLTDGGLSQAFAPLHRQRALLDRGQPGRLLDWS